jgi:hypothetical protein
MVVPVAAVAVNAVVDESASSSGAQQDAPVAAAAVNAVVDESASSSGAQQDAPFSNSRVAISAGARPSQGPDPLNMSVSYNIVIGTRANIRPHRRPSMSNNIST